MDDYTRRKMPLFPIGIVKSLTELSARQIRYYEEHELVQPVRSDGNRRLYSFHDVDRLLEIKSLIEKGVNLAGIKQVLLMQTQEEAHKETEEPTFTTQQVEKVQQELTEKELRKMLKNEIFQGNQYGKASLRQGELSRFFH